MATATVVRRPLSLDQLAALSDEVAALARAGVPLDRGLAALASDMPGRLGAVAGDVSRRMAEGHSLDGIVEQLGPTLPPVYRHVVVAGLKAGRLPAALQGVASTARRVGEMRSSIGLALIYPVIVLTLTWFLGLFVLVKIAPVNAHMLSEFQVTPIWVEAIIDRLIATMPVWGLLVPAAFAAFLIWTWHRSGRVAHGVELHPLLACGAIGTLTRLQRAGLYASLAELLGMLIAQDVPLPEAVELASGACGSPALAAGGAELARGLAQGVPITEAPRGFPPLVAWQLASGHSQQRLLQSLARTAEVYRAEVSRRSRWLTIYTPLVLTIVVAGGFVFCYAVLTLGPWIAVMRRLSEPYSPFF